ncbi:hypothetical protein ACLOAU_12935 [Niabella sp. CJ426]|jgi:hypothetical protein|uniref:hypothetical protein n=1 Tax=Niabella sp. CJ426 TaxID=3393740 RepID=UPI003D01A47E
MSEVFNTERTPPEQFSIDWDDIYYDIKTQKAILVLGPGFLVQNEQTAKQLLFEELKNKPDNGILHFNPDNEIFLFESQYHKTKAQRFASTFYEKIKADATILKCIAELPFPLVINTNPDTTLMAGYRNASKKPQFDYFTGRASKSAIELMKPDKDCPILYNLFGSSQPDALESIILDFEDMFTHLKALFENTRQVPDAFNTVLREADTYIFIGFRMEKLRTQLLMRYINTKTHDFDNRDKNYTAKSSFDDADSESFFRKQFNIKYYGAPVEFLNEIHQLYFASRQIDETVATMIKPFKETARDYIKQNDFTRAFILLENNIFDNDQKNQLIACQMRYSKYILDVTNGTEYKMNLDVELNRITMALLELIDCIPPDKG